MVNVVLVMSLCEVCRSSMSPYVWGRFTHRALLDRVESKGLRHINCLPITHGLPPLKLCCFVTVFSILYH